jgi:hypothetical protein
MPDETESRPPECETCRRCDKERDRIGAAAARIATAAERLAQALEALTASYVTDTNAHDERTENESDDETDARLWRNDERQVRVCARLQAFTDHFAPRAKVST